jgi:hypothetical protein
VWLTCEVGLKGRRLFGVLELLPHRCMPDRDRPHSEPRCISQEVGMSGQCWCVVATSVVHHVPTCRRDLWPAPLLPLHTPHPTQRTQITRHCTHTTHTAPSQLTYHPVTPSHTAGLLIYTPAAALPRYSVGEQSLTVALSLGN